MIQGYFECQDLGAQALRGVTESCTSTECSARVEPPVALMLLSHEDSHRWSGENPKSRLLLERWEQVKAGQGQVVLLTGDAGIGKSRLVQMLKEHVAHEPHVRWECRSAEYSQNTALFPLVDLFQRLLQFETYETPDAKLAKLEHALSQYRLPLEKTCAIVRTFTELVAPQLTVVPTPPLNQALERM